MDIVSELERALGKEKVLTKKEDLLPYASDASYISGEMPLAVVLPSSVEEVSKALKLCYENDVPVYVRGGGTSLTGASAPLGGIVISTLRLNKILEISIKDRYAVAEAGVRLRDLNEELRKLGYMYPPDPGSEVAATVGGSISTNAGGMRGAAYGATKDWVLGLEVVLPDGTIAQFGGKTLKRSEGYDLTALMVGSEGTLGVITKATLKIAPLPKEEDMILAFYDSYKKVGEATAALNEKGIIPLVAEFLDKEAMEIIKESAEPPEGADSMLILVLSEKDEALKALKETSPLELREVKDKEEADRIMSLRRGLYSSQLLLRERPDQKVIIGDIAVPPSRISKALEEIYSAVEKSGLKVIAFGHIGDGNIHLNVFAGMDEMEKAIELLKETARIAVKHEGSVSAEHGIGLEKKELLVEELELRKSLVNLQLMKAIKKAFDPKNIMNRGKLFD